MIEAKKRLQAVESSNRAMAAVMCDRPSIGVDPVRV